MRKLIEQLLKSNEIIDLEYGDNSLTDDGVVTFTTFCRKNDLPVPPWHIIGREWEESNPDALYQGKFLSRYERYIRDQYNRFKIPDLSTIGNELKNHISEKGTIKFQFTKTIHWENGEFGEKSLFNGSSGSCFWTVKPGALEMVRKHGFAICFFDINGNPKGRCWGYITPGDEFIIFNGYGFDSSNNTRTIAKILSWWLQVPNHKIILCNLGKEFDHGELYINNGEGFVIGENSNLLRHDLGWPEIKKLRCEKCNTPLLGVDSDDTVMTGDNYSYCLRCADVELRMCYETLELYHRSMMHSGPDGNLYCRDAFNSLFGYCEVSGQYYPIDELVDLGNYGRFVHKSRQNEFFCCPSCRNIRPIKELKEEKKEIICSNCVIYNKSRKKINKTAAFDNEIMNFTRADDDQPVREIPGRMGNFTFDPWYSSPGLRMPWEPEFGDDEQ